MTDSIGFDKANKSEVRFNKTNKVMFRVLRMDNTLNKLKVT